MCTLQEESTLGRRQLKVSLEQLFLVVPERQTSTIHSTHLGSPKDNQCLGTALFAASLQVGLLAVLFQLHRYHLMPGNAELWLCCMKLLA